MDLGMNIELSLDLRILQKDHRRKDGDDLHIVIERITLSSEDHLKLEKRNNSLFLLHAN